MVLALVLGVVGIVCFPLSLVSGGWALVSILSARGEGRRPKALAFASLGVFLVATAVNVTVAMIGAEANSERKAQAAAIAEKLQGRIEGEQLDAEAACDLARQQLISQSRYDAISCRAGYQPGRVARLEVDTEKRGSHAELTFCLARAQRWYVLSTPADGRCPASPPAQ
ncbi:MAG: hypothetical protein IPJ65_20640 [Archangiaceae bacterium]|nr:hypothetical protein [Archangiaceae bacterium]